MIFKKEKIRTPDYVPNMDEYISLNHTPEELRSLYSYVKTVFTVLFLAGFALSFLSFYFFIFAVPLSFLISFLFRKRFLPLLNAKLRLVFFFLIPPVCLSMGFFFGIIFSKVAGKGVF